MGAGRYHGHVRKLTKPLQKLAWIQIESISQLQNLDDVEAHSVGFDFANPGVIDTQGDGHISLT